MFCESYRKPLSAAAAAVETLPRELAAHLLACRSCASTFVAEQALFASIDRSLHSAANAAVPASLLARVHGTIASAGPTESWHRRLEFVFVPVFALAAVVFVVMLNQQRTPVARQIALPSKEEAGAALAGPWLESARLSSAGAVAPVRMNKRAQPRRAAPPLQAEVIVPDEERVALAKFVDNLRGPRQTARVLFSPVPEAGNKLLEIKPLQVARLEIEPLSEKEADKPGFMDGAR